VATAACSLVPDPCETAVVRLIFDFYTRDRVGARAIANALNERGHPTTTSGRWSAHQVLRVLSNRVYLGELSFRGIIATCCHPPIIEPTTFDEAQRLLAARGEDHAKRAASGSDYLLTGLIRCPSCSSAMIGTRAHGKTRIYRYYTCCRRSRYDTATCGGQRIDADAIEQAVTSALAGFYRDEHALIADAITAAHASHAAAHDAWRAQLAAAGRELTRTDAAIDRYLTAFENGTLDPDDLAGRITSLKARSGQLRAHRDALASQVAAVPAMPPPVALRQVADHIDEVICLGSHSQRKALIEALVAQVKITGPGRIVPVFRIPQVTGTGQAGRREVSGVRALTNLVRSSHLAVSCGNGCWQRGLPQVKPAAATVLCGGLPGVAGGGCGPAFPARAGVGDGQGEGFELGDQGAEPAVVAEPLPVVVELVVGDEPGDGLAVELAGPLPVGAVQDGRVGVAAAAGLAAADVPLEEGAGQREAEAGELGGDAGGAGLLASGGRHAVHGGTRVRDPGRDFQ
jgi:Recombinase/Recombinase zinc beta ribbon domain